MPQAIRILLPFAVVASGCQAPPEPEVATGLTSAERGKRVIERVGCASCHTFEGIAWPAGKVASAIGSLDGRGLIAGKLPNRPDVLAAFVRDAPSLVPGIAMPAMPLTEREARDVAAYLYEVGG